MDINDSDEEEETIPLREQMGKLKLNEPTLMPCGDEMSTLNLGTKKNKKELKIVNNEELEDMI